MPAVLVVEDDQAMLSAIAHALKAAGILVVEAQDTKSALAMLRQSDHGINVTLVDLAMPEGLPSGITFGRMARQQVPAIGVIYMTAYPDMEREMRDVHPDIVLFKKPLDFDRLAATVFDLSVP